MKQLPNNLRKKIKHFSKPKWVPEWFQVKEQLQKINEALYTGSNSIARGISTSAAGAYGRIFISKEALEEMAEDLEDQGGRYRELIHARRDTKGRFKDSIALGGEIFFLHQLPDIFPRDIEAAYSAQYPNLAAHHSLGDHIQALDAENQMGFLAGLKGKLFEQKYVDYLNNGELPDAYTASLTSNPTQQGWDILIHDADGNLDRVLQAKATSSLDYVQSALEKYPEIDVVTTEEVYAQLVMKGISDGLINSGTSNQDMINYVTKTTGLTDSGLDLADFTPPVLSLAFIAFSSYRDPKLKDYIEKTQSGGLRFGKSYMAYLLGVGVTTLTNTWWLGLAASVLSRATCDEGYRRFELMRQMRKAKRKNRIIIGRWVSAPQSC